ncbi:uncharacterized protein LOC131639707 [Vicia villosa]|uniref:uncharacterized protein LOC131639707 n=1 Tax=Vicia villosa TaxID=3911 RepID=UPI00273CDC95|nr:uncharacterized protein LOC131639707 [Vicia villosa]
MDVSLLFPETHSYVNASKDNIGSSINNTSSTLKAKSFASVVSNNVCDIPLSQLPTPCIKGDKLAITIPEEEYTLGVEACKHHLHGRVVWSKGSQSLMVANLRIKILELWPSIGKWGVTSLGKCFFEFAFSLLEDVQRVRSVNSWSLPNGILKLFPWTKYFVPATLKQISAQVGIRIHGLSQEYWRPRILFVIANSIGTLICINSASDKSVFERPFGHFVRILVDLDLTKELSYKILVERVGFAFFVDIEYEKIPEFCSYCNSIGHSITNCKRKEHVCGKGSETLQKQDKSAFIPTSRKFVVGESSKANSEPQPVAGDGAEGVGHTQANLVDTTEKIHKVINNVVNEDTILVPIPQPHNVEIKYTNLVLIPQPHNSNNSLEDDGSSESEFVDATQLVDFVPETQLEERHKEQVTDFFEGSLG